MMKNQKPKRKELTKKELAQNLKRSSQLKTLGVSAFKIIKDNTENRMMSKATIMTFSAVVDRCMNDIKISDLDLPSLNDVPESKVYKELFELFKDKSATDSKEIMAAMSGAIQEAETEQSSNDKIEDLNIKVFNDKKTKK